MSWAALCLVKIDSDGGESNIVGLARLSDHVQYPAVGGRRKIIHFLNVSSSERLSITAASGRRNDAM